MLTLTLTLTTLDIESLDIKRSDSVSVMEQPPIGVHLARTARTVTQACERAMAEAGGSGAAFQVLLLVQAEKWGNQARMAAALGIPSATLPHHLNALERDGLVRRWRDPA